jgi:ABC-2 type transport system ATP-binding protein
MLYVNPDVLILYEPTTGLDPNHQWKFTVIKTWGKTKRFSFPHNIAGSRGHLWPSAIIINNGKIVTDKKLDNLISEDKEQVIEEFDYKIEEQLFPKLKNLVSYKNTHDMIWELIFKADKDIRQFWFCQCNGLKPCSWIRK